MTKNDVLRIYLPILGLILIIGALIVFLWHLLIRVILFGIFSVGSLLFLSFSVFLVASFFSISARNDVTHFIKSEILAPIEKPILTGIVFRLVFLCCLSILLIGGFVFLLDFSLVITGNGNMDNLKAIEEFFHLPDLKGYNPCIGRYCQWSP